MIFVFILIIYLWCDMMKRKLEKYNIVGAPVVFFGWAEV
jgi:hypothetical protein